MSKRPFLEGKNMKKKKVYTALNVTAFLLPALLLFIGVLIFPIIMSGVYSLYDWNGVGAKEFIQFGNYKELFTSKNLRFMKALGNSLLLALLSVFVQLPISLGLALTLGKGRKGERFFLSVFFAPVLISTVVIGQLWLKMYNPDYGIVNMFIRWITNNPKFGPIWLGDPKLALWAAFVPTLWQYVGYHMLLMYAGVKSVPVELREAAMLDGATEGQVNRFIVIPYMKGILKVSVIFAVTGSLKSFDLIYVLTNGGPFKSTEVPSIIMIRELFIGGRYGMGSTIAVMLIVLCFFFALVINRIFKEDD